MSDAVPRWEPSRNAVHRLIQLLDVLAIAFNRFRELSFHLPRRDSPDYTEEQFRAGRQRLWDDFSAVKRAVFPREDIASQHTAAALADAAVAEMVRAGSRDEVTVRQAAQWLCDVGRVFAPHVSLSTPFCPTAKAFDAEGELLQQYLPHRRNLLAALARVGQTVPDQVVRRQYLAFGPHVHDGEEPVPQGVLLGWVAEAKPHSDPGAASGLNANGGAFVSESPAPAWRQQIDQAVSQIYTGRPAAVEPALADAFQAVAEGIRECTRLIASLPHLWTRPDDYLDLARGLHRAADRAHAAYLAVDIPLRRAGPPNAMLDALNDILTHRANAPVELPAGKDGLNAVVTGLFTLKTSRPFFKDAMNRILDQLARCPGTQSPPPGPATTPQTPAAPVPQAPEGRGRGAKGRNIDAQMLKVMAENAESHGWSAREWADYLGCAKSTVVGTPTWRERLKATRATAAADAARRMDRGGLTRRDRHGHKSGDPDGE
jgi:hypothetical protein